LGKLPPTKVLKELVRLNQLQARILGLKLPLGRLDQLQILSFSLRFSLNGRPANGWRRHIHQQTQNKSHKNKFHQSETPVQIQSRKPTTLLLH
jgi:hypothetical protein